MPRPVLRTPGGRWSLQQVYTEAGITLAVARTVVRQGLLDPDRLTENDAVLLRVAASLLDAPRPLGQARTHTADIVRERDEHALKLAREAVEQRITDPAVSLVLFPREAVLARSVVRLMAAVEDHPGEAALMLPVGSWIASLPSLRAPADVSR